MAILTFSIYFLIFCASLVIPAISEPNHDPSKEVVALFIFGDSIFDAGNNNYINTTADFQANYLPYGKTFFNYPTGRFSDGRLISDFIAEYAKLPFILPYLQLKLAIGNYGWAYPYGVNFASAGAGALFETHQEGSVIDLKSQIINFKNVTKLLGQKLGEARVKPFVLNAVYLISIGANDYLAPFETKSSIFQSHSQQDYIGMVIGNLTDAIQEIHKEGGRKFGFLSLWPIGCVPFMKASTGSCKEEVTALAESHNTELSKALKKLETKLEGFKYTKPDSYTSMSERMNNPAQYGFKEGEEACCGSGRYRGIMSCGGKRAEKEFDLCENVSGYVFFDSAHYTDRANQQFSEIMWNGTLDATGPYNLKQLFEQ